MKLNVTLMKLTKSILLLLAALAFSCGSDDGGEDEDTGPDYEFLDQDLAGEIEGVAWEYADGYASEDGGDIDITLVLQQSETGCDIFFPEGDRVFFFLSSEEGIYELGLNDGNTVTLYDEEESLNIIALKGAVEILSISATEVTGRIDARENSENFINGNFTIPICP